MSVKKYTMSDKLFDLCEIQLLSIITEAESSILKVTNNTVKALDLNTKLSNTIKNIGNDQSLYLTNNLEENFNNILINMQFFDEFSQRIHHIKEIVDLIKLESGREEFLSNAKDSEKLFNEIKGIFSIHSEFEVMNDIFPEYENTEHNNSIELF